MSARDPKALSCDAVLERLSDVIDGSLEATELAEVVAHLRGCDACSRFGGGITALVARVRETFAIAPPPPPDFVEGLLARLPHASSQRASEGGAQASSQRESEGGAQD